MASIVKRGQGRQTATERVTALRAEAAGVTEQDARLDDIKFGLTRRFVEAASKYADKLTLDENDPSPAGISKNAAIRSDYIARELLETLAKRLARIPGFDQDLVANLKKKTGEFNEMVEGIDQFDKWKDLYHVKRIEPNGDKPKPLGIDYVELMQQVESSNTWEGKHFTRKLVESPPPLHDKAIRPSDNGVMARLKHTIDLVVKEKAFKHLPENDETVTLVTDIKEQLNHVRVALRQSQLNELIQEEGFRRASADPKPRNRNPFNR